MVLTLRGRTHFRTASNACSSTASFQSREAPAIRELPVCQFQQTCPQPLFVSMGLIQSLRDFVRKKNPPSGEPRDLRSMSLFDSVRPKSYQVGQGCAQYRPRVSGATRVSSSHSDFQGEGNRLLTVVFPTPDDPGKITPTPSLSARAE